MDHMNLARKGEHEAEIFLSGKGYKILERRWYHRQKEVDLIAFEEDNLVIVEVKTRRAPVLDDPAMAIDKKKQRNLVIAANAYARYKRIPYEVRFEVIWVVYKGETATINHIRNAFVPVLW